jgi:hypothetical protein
MNTEEQNGSREDGDLDKGLLLAEYNALRNETLKRMEIENQLTTFTIIVFGTILGIGFQNKIASLILLYPLLALFLSIGHTHSDYHVRQIGMYLKDHVESMVGTTNIGWEHYLIVNRYSRYRLQVSGIFITTELLAILVGLSIAPINATFLAPLLGQPMNNPSFAINLLLGIAIVSVLLTLFMLRQRPVKSLPFKPNRA